MKKLLLCVVGGSIASGCRCFRDLQRRKLDWSEESREFETELKEKITSVDYRNDVKARRRLSEELNAIDRLGMQPGDKVVFLAPDSALGRIGSHALAEIVREVYGAESDVVRIEGLQLYDIKELRSVGLKKLVHTLVDDFLANKFIGEAYEVMISPAGGFKAVTSYLHVLGMLYGKRAICSLEYTDDLIAIPPLPLTFNVDLFQEARDALTYIEKEIDVSSESPLLGEIVGYNKEIRELFRTFTGNIEDGERVVSTLAYSLGEGTYTGTVVANAPSREVKAPVDTTTPGSFQFQKEREELLRQIEDLHFELERLRSEKASRARSEITQNEIDRREEQISILRIELAKAKEESTSNRREYDRLFEELQRKGHENEEFYLKCQRYAKELDECNREKKRLRSEVLEKELDLKRQREKLLEEFNRKSEEKVRKVKEKFQRKFKQQEQEKGQLEELLSRKKKELDAHREELKEVQKKNQKLVVENEELKAKVDSYYAEKEELRTRMVSMSSELDQRNRRVKELIEEREKIIVENQGLKLSIEETRKEKDLVRKDYLECSSKLDHCINEQSVLKTTVTEKDMVLKRQLQESLADKEKISHLEKEKERCENLEKKYQELHARVSKIEKKRKKLKRKYRSLKRLVRDVRELKEENDYLRSRIELFLNDREMGKIGKRKKRDRF